VSWAPSDGILFCDPVGSTAVAAQSEDLREEIGAYRRYRVEAVRRLYGLVARFISAGWLLWSAQASRPPAPAPHS
jgi:hypothetical protein